MNTTFTDASLPSVSWTLIGALGNQDINITNAGSSAVYYQINSLPSNLNITGKTVTIYFPNGFSLSGNGSSAGQINVNLSSSANIYLGGDVSITGNGAVNNLTQNALNLSIFALPTVNSIG